MKHKFEKKKNIKLPLLKRIKMPAVTNVEECTKEEIGVGADIAAGSQEENGYWALFKKAQRIIKITKK